MDRVPAVPLVFFPKTPSGPRSGRGGATADEQPCPAGVSGAHQRPASAPWPGARGGRLSVSGADPAALRAGLLFAPSCRQTVHLLFRIGIADGELGFDRRKLAMLQIEFGFEGKGLSHAGAVSG